MVSTAHFKRIATAAFVAVAAPLATTGCITVGGNPVNFQHSLDESGTESRGYGLFTVSTYKPDAADTFTARKFATQKDPVLCAYGNAAIAEMSPQQRTLHEKLTVLENQDVTNETQRNIEKCLKGSRYETKANTPTAQTNPNAKKPALAAKGM